jgi:hypothetical protein
MKFFPACGEGVRRVSIVVALLVFIFLFGWWSYDHDRHVNFEDKLCYDIYEEAQNDCSSHPDAPSCKERAYKEEGDCYHAQTSLSITLSYWGLWSICGIFWSYLAALTVRTLGWVTAGFTKTKEIQ